MSRTYYVYILCNATQSTLYIGMTNSLESRVTQHKNAEVEGFTKRYNVNQLVYYEEFTYVHDAIAREKQLKKWERAWKNRLITEFNPTWEDLARGLDCKGDSRLRGNDNRDCSGKDEGDLH
jgi:putative endonuclease